MEDNNTLQEDGPVFSLRANSVSKEIYNRWAIYETTEGYDVYLETKKNNKISKAHAAHNKNLNNAILFAIKMNMICSKKRSPLLKTVFDEPKVH